MVFLDGYSFFLFFPLLENNREKNEYKRKKNNSLADDTIMIVHIVLCFVSEGVAQRTT